MVAAAPRTTLLFADSFRHERLCQHVDEVRFTEPVVITACEVVELQQQSLCPSISLTGCSNPESCAVEIFVRTGGDARFQPLGPAFLHSPAATSFLDVQAAVTEHVVLRGSYKSLTLVIYGNLASELSSDHNLDPDVFLSAEATSLQQHLQDTDTESATVPQSLHLVVPPSAEQVDLLKRLLQCVDPKDTTHQLVPALLAAAAVWHLPQQHAVNSSAPWYAAAAKPGLSDGPTAPLFSDASSELVELREWVQQREDEGKVTTGDQEENVLLDLTLHWLRAGLEPSPVLDSQLSTVEMLIGGLAAAQLLCANYADDVSLFLEAGGMGLLLQVVQEVAGTSALLLFALTAIDCACRHGQACEALVSQGKEPLLVLLEQKQQPPVGQLLRRILRCLSVYQIATTFELTVQQLTKESSSKRITAEEAVAIDEVTILLTELLGALGVKGLTEEDGGVFHDAGFSNMGLLTSSLPGGSITSKASVASEEIDPSVLSILQERCLVPSLAALISHARLWIVDGKTTAAGVEFLAAIQRLLLHLLRCRPGLLFIGANKKAATAITDGLRLMQNVQEMDVVPFHHVAVLTSVGLLCRPCDLAGMLQSSISVMTAMDRLIGADKGSEAAFGSLWDLASIARSEAGRQAVLAVVQFPEVLAVLMESLNSAPQQPALAPGGEAGMNLAAEVLQKVLWDAAPTTLLAWTRHAPTLQHLLQEACSSEASIFGQILDWVEPAAVFEKKGSVSLLRYAAALIGTQNSSAGSHMDGPLDDDPSNIREHAADTELPTVLSRGLSSPLIYESAMQPLTISLRLLASLSADPGVAAELYGEGGMGVVSAVLEHSVATLQAPLSDYDEEEGEGEEEDGRMEQNKEGALLVMLLPTLLFLQTLLKRLQGAVQQYCNSKLLDMLLRLHYCVSAKPEAYGAVPPYAWTGGVLEVGAVRQVLASIIACWPIFGWTPALLPRLLGSNPTSLPGEPVEACSAICLLEEMLPPAPPILCLEKAAVMDVYRNSAVGLMSGIGVMADVQWHFSLANAEKMLHALGPHLEQLAQLILRLAPSACLLVQERLTHLVIRMSCQSVEHAAVLLNPVISTLRQQTAAATVSLLSEIDALQVERMLQWMSHLAFHPASKVVLLQGGAVQFLVQALVVPADVIRLGWLTWSCKALMALCDPAISFLPMSVIERRLAEDCASFEDCRIIASALSSLFEVMSLGKHSLVLAGVWEKLANHELGRAALASVAVQPCVSQDLSDPEPAQPPDRDNPPLLVLWQKISVEFESNKTLRPSLVEVIHHFARGANALSHQGQSACGTWALKAMFGLDLLPGTTEIRVVEDILQPVFNVASSLQQLLTDSDQPGDVEVPNNLLQEAHIAVTAMLHILAAPATEWNIEEEIKAVLGQLETPRPVAERRAEAIPGHSPSRLRILIPDFLGDSELVDLDSYIEVPTIDFRGTIPWECPSKLQEKPHMAISSLKRRPISTIELAGKRQRGEAGAGSPSVRATSAATPNRRDTFRQRKPNTSRPPSMHVDDYVAREKSSDGPTSGSPATAGPSLQRTNSSGGRPPSIHVDEFMARQRERQQSSQMVVQTSVEIVATKTGVDPMEVEDDGAIPGLLGPSHPDQKNAEQGSVTVTSLSTTVFIPPISNSTASFGVAGGAPMHSQVVKTLSNQSNMSSLSTASASDIRNMALKQFEDIKQEQINRLTHVDSSSEPLVTSVLQKVKIEIESAENKGVGQVQGPLRSYTNSHSTDVSSPTVEKEPKQSHWRSKSVRASEVLVSPGSNKSMSPISGEHQQKLQMDTDVKLNPPRPPAPSWSHRPEHPVHPQHVPLLPPPMMSTPYNFSPGSRPPADLQLGGAVLQAPSGSWREAAPSFSGPPPPPAPPPQSTMQQGPSSLPVPYGSMRPFDGVQAYPLPPSVSSSDHRFVNFAAPMLGQGIPPPPFQPQIPVGRPPVAQVPIPPAQPLHHQPLLQHQQQPQQQHPQHQQQQPQQQPQQQQQPQHQQHQASFNSQQEPAALLQQMLASPDAIQALLKDQNKLRQLLEQHPKLITLLQEKMS
ncbi:unnamed protein product [Sphagnum tenellum]